MIRFDEIEGIDIGRHRRLHKKIKGNVLGLWGVSGTGKSTFLQLVEWLLNGSIKTRNNDPIGEFIRNNEAEDIKKMTGMAKLTVDGKPLQITRSQSRSGSGTREVKWDLVDGKWKDTETSAAGAAKLIADLVGANQKAVSSIVFIRQGEFGKLFSGLDTDRREFFVRLLMLGHLEKIAGVIDTYRKQMAVTDLSTLKDQAETAYRQAVDFFELAEGELSRLKSYSKEIAGSIALGGLLDARATREGDLADATAALNAGLAPSGLTLAGFPAFEESTELELTRLRDALAKTIAARQALAGLLSQRSELQSSITAGEAWLEKSKQHRDLTTRLVALDGSKDAADPRIEIATIDRLVADRRELSELAAALPSLAADFVQGRELAERLDNEHAALVLAEAEAVSNQRRTASDLQHAIALRASLEGHDSQQCQVCGSDHPDKGFLDRAIATLEVSVEGAMVVTNKVTATQRDLAEKQGPARQTAATLKATIDRNVAAMNRLMESLTDARDDADLATRRGELLAEVNVYDENQTLRRHLVSQIGTIQLGSHTYTEEDVSNNRSKHSGINAMISMTTPSDEIEATERRLREEGTTLRSNLDRLTTLVAARNKAFEAESASKAALQNKVTELSASAPFLMSTISKAGVMTRQLVSETLEDFRERHSRFDVQSGVLTSATTTMNNASSTLQELELRIAEQKGRITIGNELKAVREAFLPTGITTDYLTHQFERIAVAAQDHLAQMSADFMVISSEKSPLSFDFVMLNEPNASWLGQNRMSGGQQVKLAIAVLLAIHELVIPQVGLLVLDEPSTHLDADSRVALAEVLRDIGARGNFQLIVCDHSPELRAAYTDEIELHAGPSHLIGSDL